MSKPYALMADLHLHPWTAFSTTLPTGLNSRLDGLLREIMRAAEEVVKRGGNRVVMAGDVFHVRGSVAPSVMNPTMDTLREIHRLLGIEFLILPGNHDLEGRETTRIGSAVTALECEYIRVCNDTEFNDDVQAILIPWHESIAALKAELERCAPKEDEVYDAIIHAPIDGVIGGLPPHGLTPEYLAGLGYRNVYAGHYHHHKAFAGGAVSIGALAHHTWSDVDSKAGFLIVDPDKGGYTWFESHLPKFIDLSRLAERCDPEDIPLLVDGNYVRVRVSASEAKLVEAAREELLGHGARAVIVQSEPKPPAEESRAGSAVGTGSTLTLEESVLRFVETMKELSPEQREAVQVEAISVLGAVSAV